MILGMGTVTCLEDAGQAAAYAADRIADACREAVLERGIFHWVLAGGSTPEQCYGLLRDRALPWESVHCWFGDERACPAGHPDRNETMARQTFLDHIPIPEHQIHGIDFSKGTDHAARVYADRISAIDGFDFVLLGMGEDGHTASLFPEQKGWQSDVLAIPVYHSPKPPVERVSMTLKALNHHRRCLILATGASKSPALKAIRGGRPLPVSRITDAEWVVDLAAWS